MALTDKEFLRRLDTLWLLARKVLNGSLKADRKTRKKGSGINFSDYSEYNFGDDYRNIDWNIYGRLDELVIKLFEVEEDVTIHILLDLSHSMQHKAEYAKQVAAALGYIALKSMDKLAIYSFADKLEPIMQTGYGRGRVMTMLRALEDAPTFGTDSNFKKCLTQFHAQNRRPGVCLVISDFFSPGYVEGLKPLRWNRHDLFCLQVLDPNELTCDWRGDVELECIESRNSRNITITPAVAKAYGDAMSNWNDELRRECLASGISYVRTDTDIPFEELVQSILRRGGLIA